MFTGLVLGIGEVVRIQPQGEEARLTVRPRMAVTDWVKGESVAVNGVCLSVETFDSHTFSAYASKETMGLTNLQGLAPGGQVNLERALRLADRLGGHLVSGHVDALATLEAITPCGSSKVLRFRFPAHLAGQVITKGSVTLDGISLTVNTCGTDMFEVNVIPETLGSTTAGHWQKGQQVNFETDVIGKYVERMLQVRGTKSEDAPKSTMTLDFLREHGFA